MVLNVFSLDLWYFQPQFIIVFVNWLIVLIVSFFFFSFLIRFINKKGSNNWNYLCICWCNILDFGWRYSMLQRHAYCCQALFHISTIILFPGKKIFMGFARPEEHVSSLGSPQIRGMKYSRRYKWWWLLYPHQKCRAIKCIHL